MSRRLYNYNPTQFENCKDFLGFREFYNRILD
ncbi:hypothetical protein ES705_33681 [subsurface metagenome]